MIKNGATYKEVFARLKTFTEEINEMFGTNFEFEAIVKWTLDEMRNHMDARENSSLDAAKFKHTLNSLTQYNNSRNDFKTLMGDEKAENKEEKKGDVKIDPGCVKIFIAFVIIFSGCIICLLPYEWAQSIGKTLIQIGWDMINNSDYVEVEKNIATLLN